MSDGELTELTRDLLAAIESSGKTDYRIAIDGGLKPNMVTTFRNGERRNITIETAGKIAASLGLRLTRPIPKKKPVKKR